MMKITYPDYKVVVVDNGSERGDVRILREKFGDSIHVIENDKNYGFAEGANIGIRYALASLSPDYLLLLNNDTVVDPEFLGEMIKVAHTDKKIGILGPKIYYYNEPEKVWFAGGNINYWPGRLWHRGIGQIDSGQFDEVADVDFISGCCMLVSRDMLSSVGLLDSTFFFGTEDYDISIRAARNGFRVLFVPDAKIWHKIGRSTGRTGRKPTPFVAYYYVRNHFILMEKHWSRLQYATSTIYFIVIRLFILYLYRDRQWSTLKAYGLGFWDYLRRKW
jgi:GT2 family glycosyltransferase